eukprot:scaffold1774_cov17-Tisochrysis_lutea.AAC.1
MSSGVQGMHFRFFALGTKEIVLRPAETKLLIDPSKASGIAFILPQIINRVADKAMIAPVITSTRHPLQGCRTPIRPDGLTKISRAWQGGCNGSFINPQILNCGKQGASWHAYSQLKIFHMIWVSKKQKQKYRAWEGAGSMFAYVDEKVPSNHLEIVFLWTGVDQLGELLCPAADFWQPSTWRHRGTYSLLELPVSK